MYTTFAALGGEIKSQMNLVCYFITQYGRVRKSVYGYHFCVHSYISLSYCFLKSIVSKKFQLCPMHLSAYMFHCFEIVTSCSTHSYDNMKGVETGRNQ